MGKSATKITPTSAALLLRSTRRKTFLKYFREQFGDRVKTVRITAADSIRTRRGWTFTPSVDDAESECGLDDVNDWDLVVNNDGEEGPEKVLEPVLKILQN